MEIKAKELRRAMAAKGFTVTSLSEAAGVAASTINGFLKHGRSSRTDTLGKLARALEVDIYDIAKEDGQE